ncbi:MAG TPA: EF-hand domain-containing protein [Planctomycetaceae bacterium]|nr:EF-hand domain-containing protein [Planctomycetaceae bacterium]
MDSSEREPTPPRSQKLNRIKHEPLPTTLPPRTRVPSKKKRKRWIPLGYGVVAATALVVVAAVIGAFVIGGGNTSHMAVDQQRTRDADLASREGDAVEPVSAQPQSISSDQPQTPISPSAASAKPGVSKGQAVVSGPRSNPTASPAAALPKTSANAAARGDAARSASAARPSTDNSDSSETGTGQVVFDGGPKKGTTIDQYFRKLDANHDGKLDSTELPLYIIKRADTSKDGELTLSELKKAFKKLGPKLFAPPTSGGSQGQRTGGL